MKNIVLTGFMGAGKTAVGRELSRLLSLPLIDIDTEIETEQGITINAIFKKFGEPRFREIETHMINRISAKKNVIISTGGGAVLKQENMDALRQTGIIVYLMARPETILQRTISSDDRPLLKVENPFEKINELLTFRKPFYEKADILIGTENKSPLVIAEEIIEQIKEKKGLQ